MPTRKKWKKPRTFKYEVDGGYQKGILHSGVFKATSVTQARRKARQLTEKEGYNWGKKWCPGWLLNAIEGTQGWIGDNDHEPYLLLWVYVPKETPNAATAIATVH